jgi:PAS domain S-box-containing protein
MRDPLLSRFLIRFKLPIAAGLLALVAAGAVAWSAYVEVRGAAERSARVRLDGAVAQMVTQMTSQTAALLRARMIDAANPALTDAILDGSPRGEPTGQLAAAMLPDSTFISASLWSAEGVLIAGTSSGSQLDTASIYRLLEYRDHPDSIALTPMLAVGDSLVYGFVSPVMRDGIRIGDLVQWRHRAASSPQSRRTVSRLLGADAALYIGSFGGAWSDQVSIAEAPPRNVEDSTGMTYHREGVGSRIGRAARVAGTPWLVLVEFSEAVVTDPVRSFERRMVAMLVIVALIAAFFAWAIGGHITDPLRQLTSAAHAMGAGESDTRVRIGGTDELSQLGSAFNVMAQRVTDEATARRESEAQWRLLFDGNPHPMAVIDSSTHRFLAVNQATVEQYGYTRDELLELTLADVRLPEMRSTIAADVASLPDRTVTPVAVRHVRKDGTTLDAEVHSQAVQFGGVAARLMMAQDVTQRVALEAQFRHAQKMEAVGRLAGGVAHDFNNLLAVIMAHGEMLVADTDPVDRRMESLREVVTATERAAGLTRQLLTFSRQQPVNPMTVAANETVQGVSRMLRPILGAEIEVRLELDEMPDGIRVDPGQFEQVLVNLAVNARDAMPRGGALTFSTTARDIDAQSMALYGLDKPGRYVIIGVNDTGMGMSPGTLARMFEPFFTTKASGQGTGLGLATAYGIIAQSGGHISVYSEVGIGTNFRIYLPSVAMNGAGHAAHAAGNTVGGTETILLVEDNDAVRNAVERMISRLGYTVLTAETGAIALKLAQDPSVRIDMLITDIIMPGMDGPTLVSAFARNGHRAKSLLISGYAGDILAGRGTAASLGVPMMQKPFVQSELAAKIREVLDA